MQNQLLTADFLHGDSFPGNHDSGTFHLWKCIWNLKFQSNPDYHELAYGTCFATFLCHGFIKSGIPLSLEEAAYIDGASSLQTFFYIVFPLLKPILATNMILQTLGLWNDYLLPNLVLGKEKLQTLPIVIRSFVGTFSSDYSLMMAALVMCVLPVIILFLFLQKYIVAGIVSGAVKA